MSNATIKVNLKSTKLETEPTKNWFMRIFKKEKTMEKEVVTQSQFLEKIYNVFSELGYKNIQQLEMNGVNIYDDTHYEEDDFRKAIEKALNSEPLEIYHFEIYLDSSTSEEDENGITIDINMYSKHEVGDYPLTISFESFGTNDEVEKEVYDIILKLEETFETENIVKELELDDIEDEDEEDDSEDEEDEDDSEEDEEDEDDSEDEEDEDEPVVETPEEKPSEDPVVKPSEDPVVEPVVETPEEKPSEDPVVEPSEDPVVKPSEDPVVKPSEDPVEEPVVETPEEKPSEDPVVEPAKPVEAPKKDI